MPDLPKIDLTKFDVSKVPSPEQVADCARNVVYLGVGFVVTTAERVVDAAKTTAAKVRDVTPVWPNRPAA